MSKTTEKDVMNYTNEPTIGEIKINELEHEDVFMIGNHEGKWRIAIAGKVVSSKEFETAEAAKEYIATKPWELIFNSTAIMYENLQEYKKQLNNK